MEVRKISALWFSATGNTDRTVNTLAETLAEHLKVPLERIPFTRPGERERD